MGWCMDAVGGEVCGNASYVFFVLLYLWILTKTDILFQWLQQSWALSSWRWRGFQPHYCDASLLRELFRACDVSESIEYMPKSLKADL